MENDNDREDSLEGSHTPAADPTDVPEEESSSQEDKDTSPAVDEQTQKLEEASGEDVVPSVSEPNIVNLES